jgi:phosphoribosylglycinamide formyltransferase-1
VSGRIVVLVSGTGSNLFALAAACERGEVQGTVVAAVADRPCTALERAEANGIETVLCEPAQFSSRDEWSASLRDIVARCDPSLVVSAGFMRILAPVFVDAFYGRLINLHPALLPAFPGAHAVRDALARGVRVTGTTVHFIDNGVDAGPILIQEAVPVEANDTEDTLHARIKEVEHRILPEACRLILEGSVTVEDRRVVITAN